MYVLPPHHVYAIILINNYFSEYNYCNLFSQKLRVIYLTTKNINMRNTGDEPLPYL